MDRFGLRNVLIVGGLLVGIGWIGSGLLHSLPGLYVFDTLGGVVAGAIYGGTIGVALTWFPDHRGMTAGFVAGAYGIGTAITVIPIDNMIQSGGYATSSRRPTTASSIHPMGWRRCPVAAAAQGATGTWYPIFIVMVIASAVDAVAALVILKPITRRMVRLSRPVEEAVPPSGAPRGAVAGGSQ